CDMKVKGDEYEFTKTNYFETGKFTLNPQADTTGMDVQITEGDDVRKKQLGIYEIKDDPLTFCFAPAGSKKRPTEFKFTADDQINMLDRFLKVKNSQHFA